MNPLTGDWVLVSPHRTQRPWKGAVESELRAKLPAYDASCYLCPGNERASGAINPDYSHTFVFTNDFPALQTEIPGSPRPGQGLATKKHELFAAVVDRGTCRVLCFSPRHDKTIARLSPKEIEGVVDAWIEEYRRLSAIEYIGFVQIFENRGSIMGCSNPHPHGQIWANETPATLPAIELERQTAYSMRNGSCMLCDYMERELSSGERIVLETDLFVILVPFWAVWPFETLVLPKRHLSSISELTSQERADLSIAMQLGCTKFDNLFQTDFPYSMGIHQAATERDESGLWHAHLHYYPPLLRSATIKKFMVGYEMLAMPQRDITPESAAERLKALPTEHFRTEEDQ